MEADKLFKGRAALLVTKHHKEKVISPLLEDALGLKLSLANGIDTDDFGTFSGETERPANQLDTAWLKALRVFEIYKEAEIAIASEGAFTPHPDAPLIPVNTEFVVFIDKRRGLEIAGRHLSMAPKVMERKVFNMEEAFEFAKSIGFPQYGVILKAWVFNDDKPRIFKDAQTWPVLEAGMAYMFSVSKDGRIVVQTDMRAHRNPLRMENIRLATVALIKAIQSVCPRCGTPGFDVKEAIKGLPCSRCKSPTRSVLYYIYKCKKCGYKQEKYFPNWKNNEDPGLCDHCNP